jgi:hypothetical protein
MQKRLGGAPRIRVYMQKRLGGAPDKHKMGPQRITKGEETMLRARHRTFSHAIFCKKAFAPCQLPIFAEPAKMLDYLLV